MLTPPRPLRPFFRLHRRPLARRYLPAAAVCAASWHVVPSLRNATIAHFKRGGGVSVVTRLMWQTAAGARDTGTPLRLEISLRDGGRGGGEGFGGPGSEVCSGTRRRANINHVDSHKIIRADHSRSLHSSSALTRGARLPSSAADASQQRHTHARTCTRTRTDTFVVQAVNTRRRNN